MNCTENTKFIKNVFFLGLILVLVGCGNEPKSSNLTETPETKTSINIKNPYFNLTLNSDWKVLEKKSESFFQAQNKDANFIIHLIEPQTDKPIEEILNRVKNNFFQWHLIDKPQNNIWSFSGKIEVILPTRNFYQKLIKISETNRYFLGSCSFEAFANREEVCKNILNSWTLKVAQSQE